MHELEGKVALVTGGSRGIGAAIALRLATDGADVALTYRASGDKAQQVVAKIAAIGRRGVAIEADAAEMDAVRHAVERTVEALGRLDILVNNAGIFPYGPFEDVTEGDLERALAIHVKAAFVGAQAAIRHMDRDGRIISIGTCLAERVNGPGMTLYAMSKAALLGLTKGLARDLGPRGITVNVVHPGPIDTDMNPADDPGADEQRSLLAAGRFGEAADIAATVAHLAGKGGRFITGAAFAVDGGFTA